MKVLQPDICEQVDSSAFKLQTSINYRLLARSPGRNHQIAPPLRLKVEFLQVDIQENLSPRCPQIHTIEQFQALRPFELS